MSARRISLTPRDLQMLAFLSRKKAAPIDVLGRRFFSRHATTGAPNKHPVRACARRLTTLAAHGYIRTEDLREPGIDGTPASLILLTPKGSKRTDTEHHRVHARHKAHHIATIRACEKMRADLLASGGGHVSYKLEHELIGEKYAITPPAPGQTYTAFPDAEVTITDAQGASRTYAVEYVTASYTDEMIASKDESFGEYEDVLWVADCARAAARVTAVTGAECAVQ